MCIHTYFHLFWHPESEAQAVHKHCTGNRKTAVLNRNSWFMYANLGTGAKIGTGEGDHLHTGRSVRERIFILKSNIVSKVVN